MAAETEVCAHCNINRHIKPLVWCVVKVTAAFNVNFIRMAYPSKVNDPNWSTVAPDGKVVERGRHEELIALDGYYKKLNDMQAL